jgi:hypothetical protein
MSQPYYSTCVGKQIFDFPSLVWTRIAKSNVLLCLSTSKAFLSASLRLSVLREDCVQIMFRYMTASF